MNTSRSGKPRTTVWPGVFGVADELNLALLRHPGRHHLHQFARQLGALAILLGRAVFLRAVEAKSDGDSDRPLGVPGQRNAAAEDDPVVTEGEELHERLAATVVRQQGVVVHASAPEVSATLAAERVVHQQDNAPVVGDQRQNEPEDASAQLVGIPAGP